MIWKYKGKEVGNINEFPENVFGFVYLIEFTNGQKYIGKKNFFTSRKRKFGKKEIANMKDKRAKKYEIVVKESNWKTYTSSNDNINKGIKDGSLSIESKSILKIAFSQKQLTYLENQALYCYGVLESDEYLNDNIQGKFFSKDLVD